MNRSPVPEVAARRALDCMGARPQTLSAATMGRLLPRGMESNCLRLLRRWLAADTQQRIGEELRPAPERIEEGRGDARAVAQPALGGEDLGATAGDPSRYLGHDSELDRTGPQRPSRSAASSMRCRRPKRSGMRFVGSFRPILMRCGGGGAVEPERWPGRWRQRLAA